METAEKQTFISAARIFSVWCRLNLTAVAKAPVPSYIVHAAMCPAEESILRQKADDLIVLLPPFWIAERCVYLCALH